MIAVEVADQHGVVTEYVDPRSLEALSAARADSLRALASDLATKVATLLSSSETFARQVILCDLTRLIADAKAYEREAARRGVLPL